MFEFDFDDLAGAEPLDTAPARPRSKAKVKKVPKTDPTLGLSKLMEAQSATAAARLARLQPTCSRPGPTAALDELAVAESARAAAALAKMKPPLAAAPGWIPQPAHLDDTRLPQVVRAAPPSRPPVYMEEAEEITAPPPSASPTCAELLRCLPLEGSGDDTELHHAEWEQDAAERAAKEAAGMAAVEREIQEAKRSEWWKRLDCEPEPPRLFARGETEKITLPINPQQSSSSSSGAGIDECVGMVVQEFKVLADVPIRVRPDLDAAVCGRIYPGKCIMATEETFYGWVRLAQEAGWVLRDMRGREGLGTVLTPMCELKRIAMPKPAREVGRQMFEVISESGLLVQSAPTAHAEVIDRKCYGEVVLAESQTYDGWVRLSDGEGWMLCVTPNGCRLLQNMCVALTEREAVEPDVLSPAGNANNRVGGADVASAVGSGCRRDALRALEAAVTSRDDAAFRSAIKAAKLAGVSNYHLSRANWLRSANS